MRSLLSLLRERREQSQIDAHCRSEEVKRRNAELLIREQEAEQRIRALEDYAGLMSEQER